MPSHDSTDRVSSVQSGAFYGGMMEAVHILREAATDYETQAIGCSKIAERNGLQSAASILRSWANGIEIKADVRIRASGEGAT